jgi:hypothetical protein
MSLWRTVLITLLGAVILVATVDLLRRPPALWLWQNLGWMFPGLYHSGVLYVELVVDLLASGGLIWLWRRRSAQPPNIERKKGNVTITGEYRNGRVVHYDGVGNRLPPVPLHIPRSIQSKGFSINEGDQVEVRGRWTRKQFVRAKSIHNLTTDVVAKKWW